ncbi:hypothetical protein AgCh_020046 [Apium graveolens]
MRAELGCAHARWAQVPSCEVGLAAHTRAELMSPHLIETEVDNHSLLTKNYIVVPTDTENFIVELEDSAKTGILMAYDTILIDILGVADPLKR